MAESSVRFASPETAPLSLRYTPLPLCGPFPLEIRGESKRHAW